MLSITLLGSSLQFENPPSSRPNPVSATLTSLNQPGSLQRQGEACSEEESVTVVHHTALKLHRHVKSHLYLHQAVGLPELYQRSACPMEISLIHISSCSIMFQTGV